MESKRKKTKFKLSVVFLVFICYVSILIYRNITNSVFLNSKERVNVIFYDETPKFYSLSTVDVNYLIKFPSEIEVLVPGGYGKYRVGALGKLASLENKPEIMKKVFSSTTGTLVDLYFYPKNTEIYYNGSNEKNFPKFSEILFSGSNANTLDRIFLFFKLFDRNDSGYKIVSFKKNIFDEDQFRKNIQGNFYKKIFRRLGTNVQIIYSESYSTAMLFSHILEGEGIRVVDLSKGKISNSEGCRVITKKTDSVSETIREFFGCRSEIGETTVSDIIFELGGLEKEWAVK